MIVIIIMIIIMTLRRLLETWGFAVTQVDMPSTNANMKNSQGVIYNIVES